MSLGGGLDSPTMVYLKKLISGDEEQKKDAFHESDAADEKKVQRAWLSVGEEVRLFAAFAGSLVAVEDESLGAAVIGRAPVEDILAIRVTESFGIDYQATIEITTRYVTLAVCRDEAARLRAKKAQTSDDVQEEYLIIDAFLAALGCGSEYTDVNQATKGARLGLSSRVRIFSMSHSPTAAADHQEEKEDDFSTHADVKATLLALEAEKEQDEGLLRRGRLSAGSTRMTPKESIQQGPLQEKRKSCFGRIPNATEEKNMNETEYDKIKVRAEVRLSNEKPLRQKPISDTRQVYRGSWLATVNDPQADAGIHHFLPKTMPAGSPLTVLPDIERAGYSSEGSESSSSIDNQPIMLRERYRDVLNSATKSAAKKAADVSRAALSVHADAERLESQLNTSSASALELESNLSLAADGAREARSRLAALEKEVQMLAGPTLRELAWAAQLRRTADARLARDLSADWNRQSAATLRYASWNPIENTTARWETRVWLELEAGDNNGMERRRLRRMRRLSSGSDSDNQHKSVQQPERDEPNTKPTSAARLVGDALSEEEEKKNSSCMTKEEAKANSTADRILVRLEPQGDIVYEFLLSEDIEIRRCKDRDAPAFALELLPTSRMNDQGNGWNSAVASALASFFDYFKPDDMENTEEIFAFAPDTLDEQRCWSLSIEQSIKDAKMPDLPEEDDASEEDDADAAIARESLTTEPLSEARRRQQYSDDEDDDDDDDDEIFHNVVQSPPLSPKSDFDDFFDARSAIPPDNILSDTSSIALPKKKQRLSGDTASPRKPHELERESSGGLDSSDEDVQENYRKDSDDDTQINDDKKPIDLAPPPPRFLDDTPSTTISKLPVTPLDERDSFASFTSNIADSVKTPSEIDSSADQSTPSASQVSKLAQFTQQVPPASASSENISTKDIPPQTSDLQPRPSSVSSKLALFTQQVPPVVAPDTNKEDQSPSSALATTQSKPSPASSKLALFTQQVPPVVVPEITAEEEETKSSAATDVQPRSSSVSSKLALFTQKVPPTTAIANVSREDDGLPASPSISAETEPRPSSVSSKLALFTQQVPPTALSSENVGSSELEPRSSSVSSKLALFTQQVPPVVDAAAIKEEDQEGDGISEDIRPPSMESKLAMFTKKVPAAVVQVAPTASASMQSDSPSSQYEAIDKQRPSSSRPSVVKETTSSSIDNEEDSGLPVASGEETRATAGRPMSLPARKDVAADVTSRANDRPSTAGPVPPRTLSPKKKLKMFKQAYLDKQKLATQLAQVKSDEAGPKERIRRVGSIEVDQASSADASPCYPEDRKSFFDSLDSPTTRVLEVDVASSTDTLNPSVFKKTLRADTSTTKTAVAFDKSVKEPLAGEDKPKLNKKAKSFSIGTSSAPQGTKRRNQAGARAQLREARERLAKQTLEQDHAEGSFEAVTNIRRQLRRAHTYGSQLAPRNPIAQSQHTDNKPSSSETRPFARKGSSEVARRLRENARAPLKNIVVIKRPDAKKKTSRASLTDLPPTEDPAKEMIRELERGSIVTIRFVPAIKAGEKERYEYECIDAFEMIDDEILAPLVEKCQKRRPSLQKLYSAWRSDFSVKTDQFEFRSRVQSYMISQVRRWLASCTLLEIERPHETCVALVRLHDDPSEYVQPIKFGDAVINWAPKRDDGSMTFNDRATSNAVVVSSLSRWLDENRVTAQRTLRIDTANAAQADDAPLNYERVYRKLFQKALTF